LLHRLSLRNKACLTKIKQHHLQLFALKKILQIPSPIHVPDVDDIKSRWPPRSSRRWDRSIPIHRRLPLRDISPTLCLDTTLRRWCSSSIALAGGIETSCASGCDKDSAAATSNAAKKSKSSSEDSSVHENELPNSPSSDDQDSVSEPDKFALTGTAFTAETKLISSVGVACADPDVGTCATTDFQYHKNKALKPNAPNMTPPPAKEQPTLQGLRRLAWLPLEGLCQPVQLPLQGLRQPARLPLEGLCQPVQLPMEGFRQPMQPPLGGVFARVGLCRRLLNPRPSIFCPGHRAFQATEVVDFFIVRHLQH
jgi:hypothetical protein